MSSTLYWEPVKKPKASLSDELKHKLSLPSVVDEQDIPYLSGLAACGVKDADKLISLIKKHGRIKLTVGC